MEFVVTPLVLTPFVPFRHPHGAGDGVVVLVHLRVRVVALGEVHEHGAHDPDLGGHCLADATCLIRPRLLSTALLV